jgi:mono/diheme cytochrome c family protein
MSRYFQSENRYRDTAVSADGKTIYVATDPGGLAEALGGGPTRTMQNKGAILAFTYMGEGTGIATDRARPVITDQRNGGAQDSTSVVKASGESPRFTAEQAAAGKVAYNSNCAVCHGSTMTNGTFAPPLAGEYFKTTWSGRTVRSFYDKATSMPPAAPASLGEDTYASIVAYILETNGVTAGKVRLPSRELLDRMTIK